MAITILNSPHSFVRFNDPAPAPYCLWGDVNYCLPVYDQSDVAFQFIIQGTEAEIDLLCTKNASEVVISLVSECGGPNLIAFAEKPQRFRLSATQILYNWAHGVPNFTSVIGINSCFKIQALVGATKFCSNCFERIADDCYTSVIEYGNGEDAFGFKYCYGGNFTEGPPDTITCEPTIVQFISLTSLVIPYTALLQSKYGNFPTVQVWVYDGMGQLVNMGVSVVFDAYPPTTITIDLGGSGSGIVIIR
jgi:hypothetical protein